MSQNIGRVDHVVITATRPTDSPFAKMDAARLGAGVLLLQPLDESTWVARPGITAAKLFLMFDEMKASDPAFIEAMIHYLYPEYRGIPLSAWGFRYVGGDAISASCEKLDSIHAYVLFALEGAWLSGEISSIITPIDSVPKADRKPGRRLI